MQQTNQAVEDERTLAYRKILEKKVREKEAEKYAKQQKRQQSPQQGTVEHANQQQRRQSPQQGTTEQANQQQRWQSPQQGTVEHANQQQRRQSPQQGTIEQANQQQRWQSPQQGTIKQANQQQRRQSPSSNRPRRHDNTEMVAARAFVVVVLLGAAAYFLRHSTVHCHPQDAECVVHVRWEAPRVGSASAYETSEKESPRLSQMKYKIAELQEAHPTLSSRDIRRLETAFEEWTSSSKKPVTVLVRTSDEQLLEQLLQITSFGKKTRVIQGHKEMTMHALQNTFVNELTHQPSTIAISSLQNLPFDAALAVQGYTDGDSNYSSFIWLAVDYLDEDGGAKTTGKECEDELKKVLKASWTSTGGTPGNVQPIIARISAFVVCLDG